MNIEIANRLYQYRKELGLSQEELAARIGVSRQAVSKWERAEASPDTDNLIELSKVYGVTLDELLRGKSQADDHAQSENAGDDASAEEPSGRGHGFGVHVEDNGDKVHIGLSGIHVHDKHGNKVDIDRHGIFVNENGEQKVYTDENGHIHRSDDILADEERHRKFHPWRKMPYPILAVVAYLLFGAFNICGGWAYGWIVLLTVPLYYTLVEAIEKRNAAVFCYPVLTVIGFLIAGFAFDLWHPGWIVFLTIPLYYGIISAVTSRGK